MMKKRCSWVEGKEDIYLKYHDEEWCVPKYDDNILFEMLILESFQAGLSWECVLNKRDAFRKAFDGFDYKKIAKYDDKKIFSILDSARWYARYSLKKEIQVELAIEGVEEEI